MDGKGNKVAHECSSCGLESTMEVACARLETKPTVEVLQHGLATLTTDQVRDSNANAPDFWLQCSCLSFLGSSLLVCMLY